MTRWLTLLALTPFRSVIRFYMQCVLNIGLHRYCSGKESARQCRRHKRPRFNPWVGKIPWGRKWQLTPVFLPGKCHGERSLTGCSSLWGRKESDSAEQLNKHTCTQYLFPGWMIKAIIFSMFLKRY